MLRTQYISLFAQTLPNALLLFFDRLVSADEDTHDATSNSTDECPLWCITSYSAVIRPIRRTNDRANDRAT